MSDKNYIAVVPEILDRLENASNEYLENYDIHKAFVYLIAELFETTNEESFVFSDGKNDGGIDCYIKNSPSYVIIQCKCPTIDKIEDQIQSFDNSVLEEIENGIRVLEDRDGEYDLNKPIKRLRGDYQRDKVSEPENISLTAIVAVLGKLSQPAKKSFEAAKSSYLERGINLKLITWEDIYNTIHSLVSPSDINFDLIANVDDKNDVLSGKDYFYALVNAFDFYKAFREHEWNLFEWNVRLQVHNSSINRKIVKSLTHHRTRKMFHHYNNGLLVTCKSYSLKQLKNNNRIIINGPQIINGCQTVRSICEAYESLSPTEQEYFRKETRVQIKVIKTTEPDFIGELVVSTNDQNPMKPRNLKSNSTEQREIQQAFKELPKSWFYQRKDGEFKSLSNASSQVKWFRKSDYSYKPRKYRVIDNKDICQVWHSFTGNGAKSLRGGIKYFEDDAEYENIFKRTPSPSFWSEFEKPVFSNSEDLFLSERPSPYQYLLACMCDAYISERRIAHKINRDTAINRGVDSGVLKADPETGKVFSPKEEQDGYLLTDTDYYINIMTNNMRDLLIELYSYCLNKIFGGLDAITCKKILDGYDQEKEFLETGFDKEIIKVSLSENILGPVYEFIRDVVGQYYYKFEAEIKAAPRLKSYLAQAKTISRLKELIDKRNFSIANFDAIWKKPNKPFFDSIEVR